MQLTIRPTLPTDTNHLKNILNTIELFPAEMLNEMIADYLNNQATEQIWSTAVADKVPVGFGYCAPEMLTEGTYNLYAIGVKANLQGNGIGGQMISYLEDQLKKKGHRVLIVETSSGDDFSLTRKFYENLGYQKEAVIRDFWSEGEDKVVYWKKLNLRKK